jgi:hypothetical protein
LKLTSDKTRSRLRQETYDLENSSAIGTPRGLLPPELSSSRLRAPQGMLDIPVTSKALAVQCRVLQVRVIAI